MTHQQGDRQSLDIMAGAQRIARIEHAEVRSHRPSAMHIPDVSVSDLRKWSIETSHIRPPSSPINRILEFITSILGDADGRAVR